MQVLSFFLLLQTVSVAPSIRDQKSSQPAIVQEDLIVVEDEDELEDDAILELDDVDE